MPPDQLNTDVERHERLLYGGNGGGLGLLARMVNVERFVEEIQTERKEAREDRRKILTAVISGIVIQIVILVAALIWTHPAVQGASAAAAVGTLVP